MTAQSKLTPVASFIALVIVALAWGLRGLGLHRGLWLDEYTTLLQLDPHDIMATLDNVRADAHHPLYFLLLGSWAKAGTALPLLRMLSMMLDALTLAAMWSWLRRINIEGALLAMLYVACAPLFVRFGLELRPYSLLTCTTVLAMWRTDVLVRDKPTAGRWATWAAALTALVAAHPVGIVFVPTLALWLAWTQQRRGQSFVHAWLAALAAPVTTFALLHWIWQRIPNNDLIAWMPPLSWPLVTHTFAFMGAVSERGLSVPVHMACVGLFALWALLLITHHRSPAWPVVVWGAGFGLLIAGYSLVGTPIFWYRALMPAYACAVVAVAMHTATLPAGWKRGAGVMAMLVMCALEARATLPMLREALEPSPYAGTSMRHDWSPHSIGLFYPDYLEASVRAETETLPQAKVESLESTRELPQSASADNVFLIVRVDLSVATHPDVLATLLQRRLAQVPRVSTLQLLLIPAHDLQVMGKDDLTANVVKTLTQTLGAPTLLEGLGSLQRWRFKLSQ